MILYFMTAAFLLYRRAYSAAISQTASSAVPLTIHRQKARERQCAAAVRAQKDTWQCLPRRAAYIYDERGAMNITLIYFGLPLIDFPGRAASLP